MMDLQALSYRFAGLFYEIVVLEPFFAGFQICGPHLEMCIAAKCWPCFMHGAGLQANARCMPNEFQY